MPHLRPRHIQPLIDKSLKFSPIVGVFGHRQVGKTTLVQQMTSNYRSLDRHELLDQATEDPRGFLSSLEDKSSNPLVIDECQLAPPLFPEMKEWVRTHPKPGQLLLTGSVRFASRKAIRESLTGRIITWELLPMDMSECHEAPLPTALIRLLEAKTVELEIPSASYFNQKSYPTYLEQGGLPGVFSVRDSAIRAQRFEAQIETILERDLRLLVPTTLPFRTLKLLLSELAHQQGEPLEWSSLSRKTRISPPTLRKLVAAFEALFLVRLLETRGTEKRPVIFIEDQGEATHLTQGGRGELTDLNRFLFAHIRPQISYQPEARVRFFQLRNRGGLLIPFCLESSTGILGMIPIIEHAPSSDNLASARAFLKKFPKGKVLFCTLAKTDQIISKQIRAVSVSRLV